MIKRTLYLTVVSLLLAGSMFSCNKLDKLTQFTMSYADTVTIASVTGLSLPFNLITPPIKTNSTELFEINDTRKDLVEEIYPEAIILNIISPEDADFSFLNSIEIYVKTEDLAETLIAWKYDIGNTVGNSISLDVSNNDLKDYLISDEIELKVTTVTDKLVFSDVDIEIAADFFVNAKILGI